MDRTEELSRIVQLFQPIAQRLGQGQEQGGQEQGGQGGQGLGGQGQGLGQGLGQGQGWEAAEPSPFQRYAARVSSNLEGNDVLVRRIDKL
jgi:hypothetical protein